MKLIKKIMFQNKHTQHEETKMKTAHQRIFLLVLLMAGILVAQTTIEQDEVSDVFRSQRALYGVKAKLSKNYKVKQCKVFQGYSYNS